MQMREPDGADGGDRLWGRGRGGYRTMLALEAAGPSVAEEELTESAASKWDLEWDSRILQDANSTATNALVDFPLHALANAAESEQVDRGHRHTCIAAAREASPAAQASHVLQCSVSADIRLRRCGRRLDLLRALEVCENEQNGQ